VVLAYLKKREREKKKIKKERKNDEKYIKKR
jgi:hypothetical protein